MANGQRYKDKESKRQNGNDDIYNEYNIDRNMGNSKKKKKKKKKKSLFKRILRGIGITILVILIMALILVAVGIGIFYNKFDKANIININDSDLGITSGVDEYLSNYRNIVIYGVDSRDDSYGVGNRSDSIIIASLNNTTKEVTLTSVYRDTYVQIEGYGLDKINHAYSYGEAPLAINTLNQNLDLNIKEFVTVNFSVVENLVDAIGGITMVIDSDEVSHLTGIYSSGTYTLNGVQALEYARIRYAEGGDYKRTERMRDVLIATLNKAISLDVFKLNAILDEMLPQVYTNISATEVLSLLPSLASFKITSSVGWPYEVRGITLSAWYGVPVTLESNVTQLHKDLFKEEYEPSSTVKEISDSIINKTGYSN